MKDSHNIFERVYNGMNVLCLDGELPHRLEWAMQCISPLRKEDFPEAMRNEFVTLQQGIIAARDSVASDEDWKRLAENYLKLYTKAARLDGTLQDVIGGLSSE